MTIDEHNCEPLQLVIKEIEKQANKQKNKWTTQSERKISGGRRDHSKSSHVCTLWRSNPLITESDSWLKDNFMY